MTASDSPPLVRMPGGFSGLDPEFLGAHAGKVFPGFLASQRWFRSKSREVRDARVLEWIPIPGGQGSVLAIVEATLDPDLREAYWVVLGLSDPGAGRPRVAVIEPAGGGPRRAIIEAFQDPACAASILEALGSAETLEGRRGSVVISREPLRAGHPRWQGAFGLADAAPAGGEQSNSAVVFGGQVLLKLFRKVEPGSNPEIEIGRFLAAAGFRHVAPLLASAEHVAGGAPSALFIVQGFVKGSSGWDDALASIRGCLGGAGNDYPGRARALGSVTGELHRALAPGGGGPAFAPEPLERGDLEALAAGILARLERVEKELRREDGGQGLRQALEGHLRASVGGAARAWKIRQHGDYHLGQVLRTSEGWCILDFEGEPARPLEERRMKQSPLKDVAGMLRSFDYAAHAALLERCSPGSPEWAALSPAAFEWERRAREAFLAGYRASVAGSEVLSPKGGEGSRLLSLLELDKAVYELEYEINNRPGWAPIPLQGIRRILAPQA